MDFLPVVRVISIPGATILASSCIEDAQHATTINRPIGRFIARPIAKLLVWFYQTESLAKGLVLVWPLPDLLPDF